MTSRELHSFGTRQLYQLYYYSTAW